MLKANQMRVEETRDIAWYKAKSKEINTIQFDMWNMVMKDPVKIRKVRLYLSILRTAQGICDSFKN